MDDKNQMASFGGGCFWCTEALIQQLKGVLSTEPGYSGGKGFNPTYREVASGLTGHAEMIRVKFDPEIISYEELLQVFFIIHNPSLLNPESDNYTQYRSIILYYNEQQKETAEKLKTELAKTIQTVYTEIAPYKAFYPAEEKHKDYFLTNPDAPYCQNVIMPKLNELRERLKGKLKEN